ncbi:MAG: M28 family peptidase [Clostridia bacterium]|nr:M28 family peptidase [Clostridia bacterium]
MQNHVPSLQKHMAMLCETIGARPTGSAKNQAAADYAFEVFRACGFEVRRQAFDCMDWVDAGAALSVGGRGIPAEPAEYSLPCDVEAGFVCVDTVDALERTEMSGKIAVLHGDLCKEPLMPKNFEFWNPDEHKRIIGLLEQKNPKAIVAVSPEEDSPVHIIQDGDFGIPCALVCGNALDAFLRAGGQRAKLRIDTERIPARSQNVIASYGSGRNKVCFSAHIDTKPATPGALDNASGVSVLLAFAQSLAGNAYPFRIEIVLLNGEDYYSNPGEMAYMRELTPECVWAVNVDGVGLKGSGTSVSFYECAQELEKRIIACAERMGKIERIEPWPMGDHMIFATVGIPAVAVTACDIFGLLDTVIHSPDDDMRHVDVSILDGVVRFLLHCIE